MKYQAGVSLMHSLMLEREIQPASVLQQYIPRFDAGSFARDLFDVQCPQLQYFLQVQHYQLQFENQPPHQGLKLCGRHGTRVSRMPCCHGNHRPFSDVNIIAFFTRHFKPNRRRCSYVFQNPKRAIFSKGTWNIILYLVEVLWFDDYEARV